jgi:hypothetical protein
VDERELVVPPEIVNLFADALAWLASGKEFNAPSCVDELTTRQAAAVLGVSRLFIAKLLEDRKIPFWLICVAS